MRKLILLGVLFLAGCQSVVGPFGYRRPLRVDDPNVPIEEQERRGRDRLAYPDITTPTDPGLEVLPRSMVKMAQ
jgi:hypothetical protein